MDFLTGAGIIDDALSTIKNNSTSVRGKMLVWLNVLAQKLVTARPIGWTFFQNGTATVTPADNILTMPADYGQLKSLIGGTSFFFDKRNILTDAEAWRMDSATTGLSSPRGYTEAIAEVTISATPPDVGMFTVKRYQITLHGAGFSGDVTVNYEISPPDFVDDANVATPWPSVCRPLLMRGLLDGFYEYDMDERGTMSYQLNQMLLDDLKSWDNMRRPKSQSDSRGLRRTI